MTARAHFAVSGHRFWGDARMALSLTSSRKLSCLMVRSSAMLLDGWRTPWLRIKLRRSRSAVEGS